MTDHSPLRRLRSDLSPRDGAKARVQRMMSEKMPKTADLNAFRTSLAPTAGAKERVWARIEAKLSAPAVSALDLLRNYLTPTTLVRVPAFARASHRSYGNSGIRTAKWTAAFAIFALLIQGVPTLFLAPRSVAESQAVIRPTKGEISIDISGFWQPISKETMLKTSAAFRTDDGEATVLLNDDGNIRLGTDTSITLHDVANRPEPTSADATLTLETGKAWTQAFVPFHVRPIIVRTPHAFVRINEGSASVEVGPISTRIRVWDRHTTVSYRDHELILVAGEWTEIDAENVATVSRIEDEAYADQWVAQNLKRDAVHRREIAQHQHELSIAKAGILPTSRLYPVKRVAEQMDVLLTFDSETRVQKKLDQATTRLNEAAALIAEGNSGASIPLEEFRTTMLEIASGSGTSPVTQDLIRQQVQNSAAQLAASKPDDENYSLKVAVLEASAELHVDVVDQHEVEAILLADAVDTATDEAELGNTERAAEILEELAPRLSSVQAEELAPEVRTDVETALQQLTAVLEEDEIPSDLLPEVTPPKVATVPPRVPQTPKAETVRRLSNAELTKLVDGIVARVSNLELPRSRWNQLQLDIGSAREEYPSEFATILRQLHIAFRDDPTLDGVIKAHIQDLRNGSL